MTQATIGMGASLARNGSIIAEVVNIDGPELKSASVEATHLQSPHYWQEFIAGLKDAGQVSFTVNYIPTDPTHNAATGLVSAFTGDGVSPTDEWELTFPDTEGTVWAFEGFVMGAKPAIKTGDIFSQEFTMKVTGEPTLN